MGAAQYFFSEVDSIGIAERHAEEVFNLEQREAKRLIARYRDVRRELRDRLDTIPGDRFTAQQLRGVLVQIEGAILRMNEVLKSGMREAGRNVTEKSVRDTLSEIRAFERRFRGAVTPINLESQRIMSDVENFKLSQYDASLEAYGRTLIRDLTLQISNLALQQVSLAEMVRRLSQQFQIEEWKLLRIARTELHSSYMLGKQESMRQVEQNELPGLMKALYHPMDARTADDSKKLARKNPIIPIDEPFEYVWQGERRVFFDNDRPNNRHIVIPAHPDWFDRKGKQKIKA